MQIARLRSNCWTRYDTNAVRCKIDAKRAAPNIPPKVNRRWKGCFSPYLYRIRNAIERMFNRLKDFLPVATRYNRLPTNFLAALQVVAMVNYWLCVRGLVPAALCLRWFKRGCACRRL